MSYLLVLLVILLSLIFAFRFQEVLSNPKAYEDNFEINLFEDLRYKFDQKISQLLPSPQSQLLSGILLGEKKDLPSQLRLALRDSSTLHIVVVSGQNLTLLGGFFIKMSGLLRRKTAILISAFAIIFYTLLTGAQVPVLRAALMVGFSSLAQLFGRDRDGVWVLFLTASLMLIFNPLWLFDLSFQLSFLATLGVVSVSPILLKVFKKFPDIIKQDLAITLGAQAMVIPVVAQNFHQISLVGLFANLLVLWTIPFIMIGGGLMLIFSILIEPIAKLLSFLISALLNYFIYIIEFFASLPFAWEYLPEVNLLIWIGYYLIIFGLLKFINDILRDNK